MRDIELVPLDPTSEGDLFQQWVGAQTAVAEHTFGDRQTSYSTHEVRTQLRLNTDHASELVAAVRAGVVVGAGRVDLPLRDSGAAPRVAAASTVRRAAGAADPDGTTTSTCAPS